MGIDSGFLVFNKERQMKQVTSSRWISRPKCLRFFPSYDALSVAREGAPQLQRSLHLRRAALHSLPHTTLWLDMYRPALLHPRGWSALLRGHGSAGEPPIRRRDPPGVIPNPLELLPFHLDKNTRRISINAFQLLVLRYVSILNHINM